MPKYSSLTGDPKQGAVPPGAYNVLESLMGEWESLVGYTSEPPTWMLLEMANAGIQTLSDFGQYMADVQSRDRIAPGQPGAVATAYPWATFGLTKDEYASTANIYATEYKKVTGQDISPEALQQAFSNPRDRTGGLLSASQYGQQLMNDTNLQKTYGWIKYGMDFSQWTQQKLQLRSTFGRDINDAEAQTLLQYNRTASGASVSAIGRSSGQQQPQGATGVGQSVTR